MSLIRKGKQTKRHDTHDRDDQIFEDMLERLTREDEESHNRTEGSWAPERKSKFSLVMTTLVYMGLITRAEHFEFNNLWNKQDTIAWAAFDIFVRIDHDRDELVDTLRRSLKSKSLKKKEKPTLRRSTINILLHQNTQSIESVTLAKKMARKIKKKTKKKIKSGDRVEWKSPHHPRKRTGTVINVTKTGQYSVKWDHGRISKSTVSPKYLLKV